MLGAVVQVEFVSAEVGGRSGLCFITEPYRPHFRVGVGEYLGVSFVEGSKDAVPKGLPVTAKVIFQYAPQVDYQDLCVGAQFVILEGTRIVGVGKVQELFND